MQVQTVWKVALEWPADYQTVRLPKGAELLTVALQGDTPCLWARVDPYAEQVPFEIRTSGTGHVLRPDVGRYLGTFMLAGGALVFHAFGREL